MLSPRARSWATAASSACPSGATYASTTSMPRSLGGGSPAIRQAAAIGDQRHEGGRGAAHGVDDHGETTRDLVQHLRTPVGGVVVHHLAGAVASDAASGAGRRGRDHPTAGRGCEGYQQAARHSAGAVDQRIVVAPASEPLHHLARGERRNGQGTRHGPVELGRLGRHVSARSEEPLCPRSLVAKRRAVDEDLVARSEPRLRGTDRTNHAGGLHAEGHRWQRAHIPGTGSDEVIPVPDAGGSDLNEHLVARRLWWSWKVELLDWPTERSDARRSHRTIVAANRRPVASALAADVSPAGRASWYVTAAP